MLPERAVDTAPRGRVSGVFGCEEDSFELGNIGQCLPRTSAGGVRGPGPPPAAQDSGRGARGAGTRTGTEPEESRARSRLPLARSVPSALRLRFVFRASLAGWANVAEISWHGFVRFYGFTD